MSDGKTEIEIVPENDRKLLDQADALKLQLFDTYRVLAKTLYHIAEKKSYKHYGYTSFHAYCEEHLQFGKRKGDYFVSIHRNLVESGHFKPEVLDEMEWTTARELASLPKEELAKNAAEWIEKAKTMPREELHREVKALKGHVDVEPTYPMRIVYHEEQYKNVKRAMKVAEKLTGSDKNNHLVDMICLEFLSYHLDEKEVELEDLLRRINDHFEVECVAVKVVDGEETIVFGEEFAKKVGPDEGEDDDESDEEES